MNKIVKLEWLEDEPGWWSASSIVGGFEVRVSGILKKTRIRHIGLQWEDFEGSTDEAKAFCQSGAVSKEAIWKGAA